LLQRWELSATLGAPGLATFRDLGFQGDTASTCVSQFDIYL